jgi:branched-chain amino acid transport system permease protein
MSAAWQFYCITLLTYFGVNLIAGWALNLQYGIAGVLNFAFIVFQACGAYVAAVVTLGPSAGGGFQSYIGGASLPWPLPLLAAALAGGLLAFLVGLVALRPAERDYQALIMLVVSIIATMVVSAQTGLFNGVAGLAGVPQPMASVAGGGVLAYGWFYVGLTAAVVAIVYFLIRRMTSGPWARRLRAMRDNPATATAIGINVREQQLTVYVVGGALASVSGAVLVQFVGAWAPSGWTYPETFLYFTALVVGGLGNNLGVALGIAVVWTGILESVRFLPNVGVGGRGEAIQGLFVGVLILAFLWLRPGGLLRERRRLLRGRATAVQDAPAADSPARGLLSEPAE